jgi:hypothetical protein
MPVIIGAHRFPPQNDDNNFGNEDNLNHTEQDADSGIYFNLNTDEQDVDSILYQNLNTDEQDVSSEIYNNLEDLRDDNNNNHAPDILNDDRANDFDGFDGWNRTEPLSYNEVETQVRIGGHRPQ